MLLRLPRGSNVISSCLPIRRWTPSTLATYFVVLPGWGFEVAVQSLEHYGSRMLGAVGIHEPREPKFGYLSGGS